MVDGQLAMVYHHNDLTHTFHFSCVRSDAIDQKFAVIETPGSGQSQRSSKKRNVKKSHGTFVDKVDPPKAPEPIRIQGT